MTNIVDIFSRIPKVKKGEEFVLTDERIREYVNTMKEVNLNSASLTFDDLATAVSVASFYSQQMKKRIDFLEGQMENDWK